MSLFLITGGCGFLGNHMYHSLKSIGIPVKVVDYLGYPAKNYVPPEDLIIDDISSMTLPKGVSHIINFAAETHVDRSLTSTSLLTSNIVGPVNLIKQFTGELFLQVSTDEVYGESYGATGDSPVAPRNPYSSSKAAAEILCMSYMRSHGVPVIITRGCNTYGPRQYPEKLIPFFLTRLLQGKPCPLYSPGTQKREWMSVEDHCRGILTALRLGTPGEIYNISSEYMLSNLEISYMLASLVNVPSELISLIENLRGGSHDKQYKISSSKLRKLGWAPSGFSLASTVQWYTDNREWWENILKEPGYQDYLSKFYGSTLERTSVESK